MASAREAMALSMTLFGRKAVASHWWFIVSMAVWMYMFLHLAMKGMSEKAARQYSPASRASAAAAAASARRERRGRGACLEPVLPNSLILLMEQLPS